MNNPTPQQLAATIKKLRVDNNFTQAEVAEKLGISRSSVSVLERAGTDINYSTLVDIACLYNIGVGKLLWLSNPDVVKGACSPSIKSRKSWIVRFGEFIFGND